MAADDETWLRDLHQVAWQRDVRLAALLLGGPDAADEARDIVEAALVAAHQRRTQFEDADQAEVWLRTAVVNRCRSARRDRILDASARRPMATGAVTAALQRLSQRQVEVLVLRHHEGLSEAAIAETLGISASAVQPHADRGLQDLADALHLSVAQVTDEVPAALAGEAAQVEAGDRWAQIVDRVATSSAAESERHRGRLGWLVLAAVAALVLGFATPMAWFTLRSEDDLATDAPPTGSTQVISATGPPSLPTTQRQLAIYYVDPLQRLTVEWRDLPTQGDRLTTAVQAVVNVAPAEPSFGSLWSGGQVLSAKVEGNVITVDLSQSAFTRLTDREDVELAVMQVVYTATAAVGDTTGSKSVRVLVDGSPNLPHLGAVDKPFTRQGNKPLAPMWISTPRSGQEMHSPLVVTGQVQGTQPVPLVWTVIEQGSLSTLATGRVQAARTSTDGWVYWEVPLRLDPGTYTVTIEAPGRGIVARGFVVS